MKFPKVDTKQCSVSDTERLHERTQTLIQHCHDCHCPCASAGKVVKIQSDYVRAYRILAMAFGCFTISCGFYFLETLEKQSSTS